MADLQRQGDQGFNLSERGGLTGQFQGHGASLYEVLLGQWLYATGRFDLAAAIILPALDTLYMDEHLVGITSVALGDIYGYQMLTAFVGDRDYDRTLALARVLVDHCQKTRFSEYARRLAAEIPRRRDDFKTLTLPTPPEWTEKKKTMPRVEQIQFLCDRLRV